MDYRAITTMAYEIVLCTSAAAFPIEPHKLCEPATRVLSYQQYARLAGRSVAELSCDYALPDAYVVRNIRQGLSLVLYNADVIGARMRHSLWHEVGHIRLGHDRHCTAFEREADCFAGQMCAPDILLRDIKARGYSLTVPLLMSVFGISESAAQLKLERLPRRIAATAHDAALRRQFAAFLDRRCPAHAPRRRGPAVPNIDICKE